MYGKPARTSGSDVSGDSSDAAETQDATKVAIVLLGTTEKLGGNKSRAFWLIKFCTVA